MQRVVLVANPSASGFTGALHRRVTKELGARYEVIPVWPASPAETRNVAAIAADDGIEVVAAMGGDGVVHHVAQGLIGTPTALGIIPAGTTNVFARILGLPSDPVKASTAMVAGTPEIWRLAHLSTESPTGARSSYATFSAGIGFDADVVSVAEQRPRSKNHFGGLHYARTALWTMWSKYRTLPANLLVESELGRVHASTVLIQVHWPYTYFGAIPIRLTKSPVDGLAAVIFESIDYGLAAKLVARLATNRSIEDLPGVHVWHGFEKLVVEAEPAAQFQADGELLGPTHSLDVTEAPETLMVLTAR